MNTKRWVAVIVAIIILIFSAGMGAMKSNATREKEEELAMNYLDSFMSKVPDKWSETVLEEGNESKRIAVISLDGAITSGGQSFLAGGDYNHDAFINTLKKIQEDPTIGGVLFKVNTPGGGTYESSEIHREMQKIKEAGTPVYVSMGSMAASGGYYVSAPATKIFASPETLTGSIGVIMSGANVEGLYEKFGIKPIVIKSGPHKDILSSTREMTEEEQKILQQLIDDSYDRFVQVVADGRGMSIEEVKKVADGRIYDGAQAQKIGLVDELALADDALAALKANEGLEDAQVFTYNPASSFFDSWFFSSLFEKSPLTQLDEVLQKYPLHSAPQIMYIYGGM